MDLQDALRGWRWGEFLDGARTLSVPAANAAKTLLGPIQDALNGQWPAAAQLHDGRIAMSWEAAGIYVEIEICPAGSIDWFCKDRRTGEYDGGPDDDQDFQLEDVVRWIRDHAD